MTAKPADRPTFSLTLRPEPHVIDPDRALRRALKVLLRSFGLRATSIEETRGGNRNVD